MGSYAGRVFAWDVVNESFPADGSVEASLWYDSPGIGLRGKGAAYIERALRWAREADPKVLLFYNDYDTEAINPKSDAVCETVKDFRARGVPIDGAGGGTISGRRPTKAAARRPRSGGTRPFSLD